MKYLLLAFSIFFFASCGGGVGDDVQEPEDCSTVEQNRFLYNYMKSWYLWNDQIPYIDDFSSFNSPNDLLRHIKVSQDRWSYAMSKREFDQDFSGNENNFGFSSTVTTDGLLVGYTLPNSPMRKAGMKRGDVIQYLNGESVVNLVSSNSLDGVLDSQILDIVYNSAKDANLKSVRVQRARYTTSPVLYTSYIEAGDDNIGYVVLESFDYQTNKKMAEVFAWFRNKNVNKIIVDLRYNGGGLLEQINYLGYMLRSSAGGKESITIKYNDNHRNSNVTSRFANNPSYMPFDFDTIVFLTSKNTASASESLIHSLTPYANVYLIGDDTHGKPVGMNVITQCNTNFLPIVFQVENAHKNSFSFNGIQADCKIEDDGRYSFGDSQESLLRAGIDYLRTGHCSSNFSVSRSLEDKIFTDIKRHKGMIVKP